MQSTEDKFRQLFGVPSAHTLKLTRLKRRSPRLEYLDFEELDAQGNLAARYHWWDRPLHSESGWRKTAPDGALLKQRGTFASSSDTDD